MIVPSYQRYDYLKLTLQSILAQTYGHLELIVVSDGHDEKTKSVVQHLNDPRATYFAIEHQGLPAPARNEGLRQCKADWIAFCDDDDLWHPEKLEMQLPILKEGDYKLCVSDYQFIDSDGQKIDLTNYFGSYYGRFSWQTFYQSMGFICNASAVFSRQVFKDVGYLNEASELRAHEDFEYWMRVLFQGDGYLMTDKLVSYRIHGGSIQRDKASQVFKQRLNLLTSLNQSLPIPPSNYRRKLAKISVHFFLDQFPFLKSSVRKLQGKTQSV
ncbi:MAG: glycosyltransferase family 2 protein [Planctomycetota bacterium]